MRANRRSFLGASMMAAAYPYDRLLAKAFQPSADLTLSFEDAGGSTLNDGAQNNRAFTKAIRYLDRKGGGTLFVPAKVYPFSGASNCIAANVTVLGYGATFAGENCRIVIGGGSSRFNLHGLSLLETSGASSTYLFDCYGSECHFKDVHLEKNPVALGYIAYCRDVAFGNVFENVSFAGSNGIFLAGHDHQVIGGWAESAFGDDCWVVKATASPAYNIRISGFRARKFTAILSIGSEIGTANIDNPDRDLFVKNVLMEDCTAEECTYLAYIKPGGVENFDYRDGVVEDITIRSCQLNDHTGQRFRNGIYVSPGRGAIVRRLSIQDVTITARGKTPAVQSVSALFLQPLKVTDGAGTPASIEDVSVSGLRCIDPYGGAALSASAPGTPIHSLVAIEKLNPAIGKVGRVDVQDSEINGCARMAIQLGSNLEGPIAFNRCMFQNYAAAIYAAWDKGSVLAQSPLALTDITATPSPIAPSDTRGVIADATPGKATDYLGDISRSSVASVPAGGSAASPLFTSTRDTWISKVEVSIAAPIPASDSNFVRFTLRNSATGAVLGSITTSSGLLAQAGVEVSFNGDVKFTGATASIPKGAQLMLEVTQSGSGADVVDPTFTVHCVPYGTA